MVNRSIHEHDYGQKYSLTMYTRQSRNSMRNFQFTATLCELVVDYANGKENDIGIEEERISTFIQELFARRLGLIYWSDFEPDDRLALIGLPIASEAGLSDRETRVVRMYLELSIVQKAKKELLAERDKFRSAVRWLCSPKDRRRFRPKARKLFPSRWPFGRNRFISRVDEEHIRYLEAHGLEHTKPEVWLMGGLLLSIPSVDHFIDLFCSFLLNECSGLDSPKMPIKICQRCGKFFSALSLKGKARIRREYCSEKCQREKWWTPEKRADDAFVKRLERRARDSVNKLHGYSIQDLRKRLNLPNVRQRLAEIDERWATEWPTIVERIRKIEMKVASIEHEKHIDNRGRKPTKRVRNGTKGQTNERT